MRQPVPHRCLIRAALASLIAAPALAQAPAPDAAAPSRFPVLEYRVQGNTVLPGVAIEGAVYPHLGPARTAADIENARAALEKVYADAGYATVGVELPRQVPTGGVVILQVVERPVGRLRVAGARWFLPSAVRAGAPSLAEGTVPHIPAVQRDIIGLNTLPDRRVTPDLRQGRAPNTVDVDLQVEDTFPLHGSLELNNRRSRDTRELRLQGSVRYDNLWQRGDSINVGYTVAPQRREDVEVFSASYTRRLAGNVQLIGSVLRSNSDVATLGGTNVLGRGTVLGLRGLVPLRGAGEGFSHSVVLGIDYKDFEDRLTLGDFREVPIQYYPLSAAYNASWYSDRSNTDASATLTWTFRGPGSDAREFELKRAFANPTFAHLRAQVSHTQRLERDIVLFGSVEGQWAGDPLISNEQFGTGGLDSVRGYLEVETLGDYGLNAQAEIRSPSIAPRLGPRVNELRFHGFVDAGSIAIHRPLAEQRRGESLLSTGVGARIRLYDRVNGSLEGAAALADGPVTRAGSVRALFRLWGEF